MKSAQVDGERERKNYLPTINAAAADHVVLEQGEEEEEEEMRALELICGEKGGRFPLNVKKGKSFTLQVSFSLFLFFWVLHCSDFKPCKSWALQVLQRATQ